MLDYPGHVPPRNRPIRPSQVPDVPESSTRPGTKGRPTPKRRVAEEARRTPLVKDPKAARKDSRAQARAAREKERQALLTNDERHYPYRDRGPVQKWARDYVDSRRSWREYLILIAVGLMLVTFVSLTNAYVAFGVTLLTWVLMIYLIVSSFLYNRKIKRLAIERFGEKKVPDRIGMYALTRAFQSRRSRLPKPEVAPGDDVR